jgi:hypothetical protein
MQTHKWKIDFYDSCYRVFGLYFNVKNCFGFRKWKLIEAFEKREQAKALYDKIKDLPEYLD